MSNQVPPPELAEDQFAAVQTFASFDAVALAEELREGVLLLLAARRDDTAYHAAILDSFAKAQEQLAGVERAELVIDALRPAAEAAAEAQRAAAEGDEASVAAFADAGARSTGHSQQAAAGTPS